jgi:hypothetical protein
MLYNCAEVAVFLAIFWIFALSYHETATEINLML